MEAGPVKAAMRRGTNRISQKVLRPGSIRARPLHVSAVLAALAMAERGRTEEDSQVYGLDASPRTHS